MNTENDEQCPALRGPADKAARQLPSAIRRYKANRVLKAMSYCPEFIDFWDGNENFTPRSCVISASLKVGYRRSLLSAARWR